MLRKLTAALVVNLLAVAPVLADAGASKPRFDDVALRYYASLGQKDRVAAEARRLSKLDPNWRVPDDLYSGRPSRADEAPLWKLYGENRIEDLHAAIATRHAFEPGWTPSDDLQGKIKIKLLRAKILVMARAGAWHAIVESFKESGIAWAKDDAEALWVIAEAYARENDCTESYVVYRSILVGHMTRKSVWRPLSMRSR